jgi:hypothetical protein
MILARNLATRFTKCRASADNSSKNNIVAARKLFEKKRLVSLKDNFNKLILIATADTKEITDFVKELDELHKKELNYNKKKDENDDADDDADDTDAEDKAENVFSNDQNN